MYTEYILIEKLYHSTNEIIDAAYCQDYDTLNRGLKDVFMPSYQVLLEEILTDKVMMHERACKVKEQFLQITRLLLEAQEQKDYLLLADYLELLLQPALGELMNVAREESDLFSRINYRRFNAFAFPEYPRSEKKEYQIELTQQGPLTIKSDNKDGCFYFHSNVNPWKEAARWTETYGEDTVEEYAVLGLGLGYHIISLWKRTQGGIPVHVYEPDAAIMTLAERYQDFRICRGHNLYIHYDPNLRNLMKKLGNNKAKFLIHYPSLRNIQAGAEKEALERYFVEDSSRRKQMKYLYANFISNRKVDFLPAEELRNVFSGRDIFIVAAGPSLDKNILYLRNRSEESIVLATGTVFRKLMGLGIKPDYVIITEANERIFSQVYPYRNGQIPIIVLSSAYYRLCTEYQGQKYMVFQKDFAPAEEYAAKYGYLLFETGGSVSTTALDVCIRLQPSRIIFLGLDLAYTENLAHANDTSSRMATDRTELFSVMDYNGDSVYSDHKFNIYAMWMEDRLRKEDAKQVTVINATEGGRYIKGMEYRALKDVLMGTI